jgi:hypothetical protein
MARMSERQWNGHTVPTAGWIWLLHHPWYPCHPWLICFPPEELRLALPSGNVDEDVVPFNGDWKRWLAKLGIQAMSTRCHVELPAVPGAGDNVAAYEALRQGAASMRADAVQSMKAAVQME